MPTGPIPGSDGLGLLPLLNGGKIVALDAEGAVLETPGGTRQSYRRKPDRPGRVLISPRPGLARPDVGAHVRAPAAR